MVQFKWVWDNVAFGVQEIYEEGQDFKRRFLVQVNIHHGINLPIDFVNSWASRVPDYSLDEGRHQLAISEKIADDNRYI